MEPMLSAVGAQSHKYWTARELPRYLFLTCKETPVQTVSVSDLYGQGPHKSCHSFEIRQAWMWIRNETAQDGMLPSPSLPSKFLPPFPQVLRRKAVASYLASFFFCPHSKEAMPFLLALFSSRAWLELTGLEWVWAKPLSTAWISPTCKLLLPFSR